MNHIQETLIQYRDNKVITALYEADQEKKKNLEKNPGKDFCNGLIGQSWSIEALMYAANYFDIPKILKIAKEVFLLHPFDEKSGLWRRTEVNGSFLSVDETFNHQLWFAASGSLICQISTDEEINNINKFFIRSC